MSNSYLNPRNNAEREVVSLASIFDDRNAGRGPNTDYGLLHGALILLVSGWETYCEDVSKEAVKKLPFGEELNFETLPESIRREILKHAYPSSLGNRDPLETGLNKLPGDGWKTLLEEMVGNFLHDFNAPKFERVKGKTLGKLFKLYLSADIGQVMSALTLVNDHANELDRLIGIRGDIAHGGKPMDDDRFNAEDLRLYLSFFQKACAAIDCIVWYEFRWNYDITPWRMTRTITRHLPEFVRIHEIVA